MIRKTTAVAFIASLMMFFASSSALTDSTGEVLVGDPFPSFTLHNNLSKQTIKALTLPEKETIGLEDFPFEIILIEFLNVHCHTCKEQVPIFNRLWESLQSDQTLKSKATFIGITAGNNVEEIKAFQESFDPRYPLLADSAKKVFNSIGNLKGTPQVYLLKRDPSGTWYLVYHHTGAVSSHEVYLRKIEDLLKSDLEGNKPGYKVPRVFLTMLTTAYPRESFENRKLLIYFPVLTAFPLEEDMRNTTPQMRVLQPLVSGKMLALVMVGPLNRIFPPQDLEVLQKTPNIFLLEDEGEVLVNGFEVGEEPLVCLVNNSGRIVYRANSLTPARAQALLQGRRADLTPNFTNRELLRLMQGSMEAVDDRIKRVETNELENGVTLYVGFADDEMAEASLFGRIVSKYSICDICHDTHFYYLIDRNGKLVYFNPIHVTKYGNLNWNYQDIITIKSRVMGKDLFEQLPFDPYVDAVSQATMSSYLIFEGLNETRVVLQDFSDAGFRRDQWRQRCFHNLQKLKEIVTLYQEKYPGETFTREDQSTLDLEKLQKDLPSHSVPHCPTNGNYLLMGDTPLCSAHGMHID
jgi:peroxiredoxin